MWLSPQPPGPSLAESGEGVRAAGAGGTWERLGISAQPSVKSGDREQSQGMGTAWRDTGRGARRYLRDLLAFAIHRRA